MKERKKKSKKLSPQMILPLGVGIVCMCVILMVVIFVTPKKATASQLQENLKLGSKYLDAGEYDKAEVAFNDALKIDKKSTDATLGLAKVYNGKNQPEKALDMLKKAGNNMKNTSESTMKKNPDAWNSRMNSYQETFSQTETLIEQQGKDSQMEEAEKELRDLIDELNKLIDEFGDGKITPTPTPTVTPTPTPTPTPRPRGDIDDGADNSNPGGNTQDPGASQDPSTPQDPQDPGDSQNPEEPGDGQDPGNPQDPSAPQDPEDPRDPVDPENPGASDPSLTIDNPSVTEEPIITEEPSDVDDEVEYYGENNVTDEQLLASYAAQLDASAKFTGSTISYVDSSSMAVISGILKMEQRDIDGDQLPELLVISVSSGTLQFEVYKVMNGNVGQVVCKSADLGFGIPVEGITYGGSQECFVKDNGDIGIASYYSGMVGEYGKPEVRLSIALYRVNSDTTVNQIGNVALIDGTQFYLNGNTPQDGGKEYFISQLVAMGLDGSWVSESADILAGMDLINNPMQDTAGVPNPVNPGLSLKETGVQDLAVINVGMQPGSSSMDFSVN